MQDQRYRAPEGKVRLIAIRRQLEEEEESEFIIGDFEADEAKEKSKNLNEDPHFSYENIVEAFDDKGRGILL